MADHSNPLASGSSSPPPRWLASVFTLDARSLAVTRVGLGLVLLLNLWILAPDIPAFFTDSGLLPREARTQLNIEEQFTQPPYWVSLNMLSGEAWFQQILFAASAVCAFGVLVGYRTQASLLASWFLLVSLQARNPLITQAGDDVLRCLLFWSIFLPLGRRWSLDARRATTREPDQVCSIASVALVVQLACIYLFTALLKTHAMWRTDLTAVYYALAGDQFTSRFGQSLLHYPNLLRAMTLGTVILEIVGPLALLLPVRGWKLRTTIVVSFWLLHLGIAATFMIGLFPATCIIYWAALLPAGFWNLAIWQSWRHVTQVQKPIVACAAHGSFSNLLIATLLAYVVLLNVTRLTGYVYAQLPMSPIRVLGDAAQLNQYWCMFSPRPHDFQSWFDMRGTLTDGRQVNLLQPDRPLQIEPPEVGAEVFSSLPWRKCIINLMERDCPTHRRCMANYLTRRWNESHDADEQVASVQILLRKREIPASGDIARRPTAIFSETLWPLPVKL